MIRRIKVRNFLSLKEVDLNLGLRSLLVGPNMSGKSNLFACLKFLSMALGAPDPSGTSGFQRAIFSLGGFREVAWKGADDPTIRIAVTIEIPCGSSEPPKIYDYEVSLTGSFHNSKLLVESESLNVVIDSDRQLVFEVKAGRGRWTINGTTSELNVAYNDRSILEFIGLPDFEGTAFRNLVATWRFYKLVPALMRDENRPTPEKFLNELGANFSSWLMTLQTFPKAFARLKQVACDTLPSLSDLLIQPTQLAAVTVGSLEKNLRRAISIQRMSDGELAFLGLLSLIFAPQELAAPLYCIEEPESHLHPQMLETLVEVQRQRQDELGPSAAQIIATTHSPQLVDKMQIEDLLVVEKVEGQTRFSRPSDDEELRSLVRRKDLGLGDLWYTGALSRD